MGKPTRSEGEPHDRLTRICDAMSLAMEAHPEKRPGDRGIVFLDSTDRGGLVTIGYDDDAEAVAAIFAHLQAIFQANGSDLQVVPLPVRGEG